MKNKLLKLNQLLLIGKKKKYEVIQKVACMDEYYNLESMNLLPTLIILTSEENLKDYSCRAGQTHNKANLIFNRYYISRSGKEGEYELNPYLIHQFNEINLSTIILKNGSIYSITDIYKEGEDITSGGIVIGSSTILYMDELNDELIEKKLKKVKKEIKS